MNGRVLSILLAVAVLMALAYGVVCWRAAFRQEEQAGARSERLRSLCGYLLIYSSKHKAFPQGSGSTFLMSLWDKKIMDLTRENAALFYCPSTGNEPPTNPPFLSEHLIEYCAVDQNALRHALEAGSAPRDRYVLLSERASGTDTNDSSAPLREGDSGLLVLRANGEVDFIPIESFGTNIPVIGPNSPIAELRHLVPYKGQ